MNENKIYWYHVQRVGGYIDENGVERPIFYKEGNSDSSVPEPTGEDAKDLADGCKIWHSDTGAVRVYNKRTDAWRTLTTIE